MKAYEIGGRLVRDEGPWTLFWDMHSGGGQKADFAKIYIQAPEAEAKVIFYNRFGHSSDRVSCTCCGPDYSVSESSSLAQASGYHRGCDFDRDTEKYVEEPSRWKDLVTSVEQYFNPERQSVNQDGSATLITADEIKPEERVGEVPEQGYVWRD